MSDTNAAAARARGDALRSARAARARTIRRRIVAGSVALFVAAWLLIAIVLVSGHDPALAKKASSATSSSSATTVASTPATSSGTSTGTSSGTSTGTSSGTSTGTSSDTSTGTSSGTSSGGSVSSVTTSQS